MHATLSNNSKVTVSESVTAPIVVRGRSPRNFQARKEIPLLGSSAGSRGQALVENGLGVVAGTLSMKQQQENKSRGSVDMQVPRSAFTFSAPKPPAGPMTPMRSKCVLPCLAIHLMLTFAPARTHHGARPRGPSRKCRRPDHRAIQQRRWAATYTPRCH